MINIIFIFLVSSFVLTSLFQNCSQKFEAQNDSSAFHYPKLSSFPRNENGDIEIPAGSTAYIDRDTDVSTLLIQGKLICGEASDNIELKAKTIIVNGIFECGTEQAPFIGKLTISLKHNPEIIPKSGRELNGQPANPAAVNYRALIVNQNGKLILHGEKRETSAKLASTAEIGATIIALDRMVSWKSNDEIAIAPTSYEFSQGESVKISSSAPTTLYLSTALRYRHWGDRVETYQTQRGAVPLDQRAEVINLSRNIKIQADDPADQLKFFEEGFQLGGHVMINQGGIAQIDSVEFFKMGQAGLMGRYPFHWHIVGNGNGQYIKNSSIHTSFQRCITIHSTNNTLVENNSCFNFRGHGYFLEIGDEIQNILRGNIGIGAYPPFPSKVLLSSDNLPDGAIKRFPAIAVFWISNPQNTIVNNIAAGSVGTGFWNAFELPAITLNTIEFSNNIAHSTLVGHTWDGAPDATRSANNPNNPGDYKLGSAHYRPTEIPIFRGLIAYKNSQTGIYFRGQTAVYDGAILADNSLSLFLAYNQIVKNSTVIGRSLNNGPIEDSFTQADPQQVGITMYDGPFELSNVDFLNFPQQANITTLIGQPFDRTSVPIFGIGGSEKFTNRTAGLRFYPEPKYRAMVRQLGSGWQDDHLSQSIRDEDGSLTGSVNGLLLGSKDFSTAPNCIMSPRFLGMKVCPASTRIGTLRVLSVAYGGTSTVSLTHVLKRSDGAISLTSSEFSNFPEKNSLLFAKTTLINSPIYTYELSFVEDFSSRNKFGDIFVLYYTEEPASALSPIIKLIGYGSQCNVNGAVSVNSLQELDTSSDNAFYSNGSEFYFRVKASGYWGGLVHGVPNSGHSQAQIGGVSLSCANSVPYLGFGIRGVIDGITHTNSISGWACNYGTSDQVQLHFYARSADGNMQLLSSTIANESSESAVGVACGDPSGRGHRFNYHIPANIDPTLYVGKTVYIFGINYFGNSLINGSGNLLYQ